MRHTISRTILLQLRSCATGGSGLGPQNAAMLVSRNALASMQPVKFFHTTDRTPNKHFRVSEIPHPLEGKKKEPAVKPANMSDDEWANPIHHQVWTTEEVNSVQVTHVEPQDRADRAAFKAVQAIRWGFDVFSGYKFGDITTPKLLRRVVFLETVAGVPGMVAGALRHLKSLRRMERDMGWIHTLLEEAENERMHLLTFMKLKQPGIFFRGTVLIAQGIMWNTYFLAYLISPRFCHRLVGYIEEEAVKTYTSAIQAYDDGKLPELEVTKPPKFALGYWKLPAEATMRDLLLAVRADEANHRDVNHVLSELPANAKNPFIHVDSDKPYN